jgi:DNA uptake protein ComE-like DNA-binding protein
MWIVWSFVPGINWMSWLHAGVSTGKIRYSHFGLLYSIPFFFSMIAAKSPALFNIGMTASMILWVICLIHVFKKRNEINLEVKYAKIERARMKMELEKKVASDYKVLSPAKAVPGGTTGNSGVITDSEPVSRIGGDRSPKAEARIPEPYSQISSAGASLIDLNAADEAALAALPGVGVILAKKAIQARQERGGFQGFDEFCDALDLQPQIREKLRPLVIIRAPAASPPPQQPPERGGRVVDF